MTKHLFPFLFLTLIVISCNGETTVGNPSETDNNTETAIETIDSIDIYENDWKILKKAIVDKNEAVVLTFVSNEDPVLKEAIDISYEFIFDDEVIEKIKNLSFEELEKPGICGTDENGEITNFDNRFIYLKKEIKNDSAKQLTESALEIELFKSKNGLKITNYKTFHQVYDIEQL